MFNAFVNSGLFIVVGPSILFTREIVRKSYVIKKPFILILFCDTIADFIILSLKSLKGFNFSCVIEAYFLFFK